MKTKIAVSIIALFFVSGSFAQVGFCHTCTSGDMRTFFTDAKVSMERPVFTQKPNTVGSPYLFNDWVKGTVVNNQGTQFASMMNFDKISQNLFIKLLDTTGDVAFMVDKAQVKAIYLSDGNTNYQLERVPSLNKNLFYIQLVKGARYSLYSSVKTTFIPSNYETNGIVTSGNLYDEYKDEVNYYVVFADGTAHEISLKKKSIKSLFETDKDKVEEFFRKNDPPTVDEKILSQLVESLN